MSLSTRAFRVVMVERPPRWPWHRKGGGIFATRKGALEKRDYINDAGGKAIAYESEPIVWKEIE